MLKDIRWNLRTLSTSSFTADNDNSMCVQGGQNIVFEVPDWKVHSTRHHLVEGWSGCLRVPCLPESFVFTKIVVLPSIAPHGASRLDTVSISFPEIVQEYNVILKCALVFLHKELQFLDCGFVYFIFLCLLQI